MTEQNYPVGKGKPPVRTQFKKGQSGNPGGKPKTPKPPATTSMQCRLKEAIEEAFLSDCETLRKEVKYNDEVVEPMRRLARGFVVDGLYDREGRKLLFALMEKLDQLKTDEKVDKREPVSLTEGKAEGKPEGKAEDAPPPAGNPQTIQLPSPEPTRGLREFFRKHV